jgi:hypothetical protein
MPTLAAEGLHKYFVFVDVTLWLAVPRVLRLLRLHQRSLALSFRHRDSLGNIAKSDTSESSNVQLHYLQPKIMTIQFLQPASCIFLSFQGQRNCLPEYKTHAWTLSLSSMLGNFFQSFALPQLHPSLLSNHARQKRNCFGT